MIRSLRKPVRPSLRPRHPPSPVGPPRLRRPGGPHRPRDPLPPGRLGDAQQSQRRAGCRPRADARPGRAGVLGQPLEHQPGSSDQRDQCCYLLPRHGSGSHESAFRPGFQALRVSTALSHFHAGVIPYPIALHPGARPVRDRRRRVGRHAGHDHQLQPGREFHRRQRANHAANQHGRRHPLPPQLALLTGDHPAGSTTRREITRLSILTAFASGSGSLLLRLDRERKRQGRHGRTSTIIFFARVHRGRHRPGRHRLEVNPRNSVGPRRLEQIS